MLSCSIPSVIDKRVLTQFIFHYIFYILFKNLMMFSSRFIIIYYYILGI